MIEMEIALITKEKIPPLVPKKIVDRMQNIKKPPIPCPTSPKVNNPIRDKINIKLIKSMVFEVWER